MAKRVKKTSSKRGQMQVSSNGSKESNTLGKKQSKKNPPLVQSYLETTRTFGQKSADFVTEYLGSWIFILFFIVFMIIWIYLNVRALIGTWDPYPFILLNFVLSCMAALQAPIILMSQNRQAERDRINFRYDYQVNRKAEREVQKILRELVAIKRHVYDNLNHLKEEKDGKK